MKIYAISDTHFGHNKLIEYGRLKGFSELILKNLSKTEGDILIHCGDFCGTHDLEWSNKFFLVTQNFKNKILIRGNHDNKSNNWYYTQGWNLVCEEMVLKISGKLVIFTHKPLSIRDKKDFDINYHGHLHGGGINSHRLVDGGVYDKSFHQDLSPDIRDYKPVRIVF